MKKQYLFLIAIAGSLTLAYTSVNRMNSRSDTTLGWWTVAMASASEYGGTTSSLGCGGGSGKCEAESTTCKIKLSSMGNDDAVFKCKCDHITISSL